VDLRGDEDEDLTPRMPEAGTYGAVERHPLNVIEGGGAKPSPALRAIAAGDFVRENIDSGEKPTSMLDVTPVPSCVSCELPLEEGRGKMAGKFACHDEACGMYGKEQKGKR
jgi:hypothetical protein